MNRTAAPRISIISPILNVQKYIGETLESILSQSFTDWELIVMDGGSTDGTLEIVRAYARKDPRIRMYSEPDEGVAHAADKGYRLARGEFITTVCGQDGFLDKDWMKKCIEVFDRDHQISLVWALSKMMTDDGRILEDYYDIGFGHLISQDTETKMRTLGILARKSFSIIRDVLFGGAARRRSLLQKIFSPNASLRTRLLARRSFPRGQVPQKEEWFRYWLETGIPFSDQSMVVSRKVFLECLPRYEPESRAVGYMADFYFHFNSRGYLSLFLPIYPVFVRWHPNQSGEWAAADIHAKSEEYLDRVRKLRKDFMKGKRAMSFVDRDGNLIS